MSYGAKDKVLAQQSKYSQYSQYFIMTLNGVLLLLRLVGLFMTPWIVTRQAPLSMGFPRQEHWSGLLFPPPGDLPDLGIEPTSPALQADSLTSELLGNPRI